MRLRHVFESAVNIFIDLWRQPLSAGSAGALWLSHMPALSSGFSGLDKATGLKGLPQGKITELLGPDQRGVVSIAAAIAAKFQRRQFPVTIIDMAGNFEPEHGSRCGLVAPDLLRRFPANAYELIGLVEQAARQKGLVVINLGLTSMTLAGIDPVSLKALLRRLCRIAANSAAVFLYLTTPAAGDPLIHTNYPPGFPLAEVADIRLWVHDEGWIIREQQINGYRGNITVIKNQLGANGKGANVRILFVDPGLRRLAEEFGF